MLTLERFATPPESIPTTMAWAITELAEARGQQELFIKQSPQKLKVLDLERLCTGVSRDHIRCVLKTLRSQGQVECLGRGSGALWRRKEGHIS